MLKKNKIKYSAKKMGIKFFFYLCRKLFEVRY